MAAVTSCENENDLFRIQNKPIAQLLYKEKRFFKSESNKKVAFQLIKVFFLFFSYLLWLHCIWKVSDEDLTWRQI